MQFITETKYLNWHQKLDTSKIFRYFWEFSGIYAVGFFYAGVLFFLSPERRPMAVLALIAFLFAKLIVSGGISLFYKKQRPYQRLKYFPPTSPMLLTFLHKKYDSMPSGHAASLAAISTVCFIFFPLLGVLGIIVTAFNGVARIVLGYHHPSDVIAGWLIGILSGYLTYILLFPRLFT